MDAATLLTTAEQPDIYVMLELIDPDDTDIYVEVRAERDFGAYYTLMGTVPYSLEVGESDEYRIAVRRLSRKLQGAMDKLLQADGITSYTLRDAVMTTLLPVEETYVLQPDGGYALSLTSKSAS